jgi:hypothetical protein
MFPWGYRLYLNIFTFCQDAQQWREAVLSNALYAYVKLHWQCCRLSQFHFKSVSLLLKLTCIHNGSCFVTSQWKYARQNDEYTQLGCKKLGPDTKDFETSKASNLQSFSLLVEMVHLLKCSVAVNFVGQETKLENKFNCWNAWEILNQPGAVKCISFNSTKLLTMNRFPSHPIPES